MEKQRNVKQTLLQLSFGIGLIFFAVLIELLAVHPSGIYSYTQKGYNEFKIGVSKEQVLKKINRQKAIRTIKTCDPDNVFELQSRKLFKMEEDLLSSDFWICPGRTGKDFLFLFKDGFLDRILLQRLRFGKKEKSTLFSQCSPERLKEIDKYLNAQEKLSVFYDIDSRIKKKN